MLSWWLYAGHRGRGYATRAVRILVDYALTAPRRYAAVEAQGGARATRPRCASPPGPACAARVVRRVEPGTGDRAETHRVRRATPGWPSDPPITEPEGVPGAAQLLPPPQARDQPAAGPRPRRPGADLPAHLQARLGPPRRRRRGRRVARSSPPGREIEEELALAHRRRRPAADRLAAAVGRLGRRRVPGLRRRRARREPPRPDRPGRPARSGARSSPRSSRCASAAPTSPPAGSSRRWPTSTAGASGVRRERRRVDPE